MQVLLQQALQLQLCMKGYHPLSREGGLRGSDTVWLNMHLSNMHLSEIH